MANRFAESIEKLLSPLVGGFVAKMAVKSQCRAIGITPEDIGPQHLSELAQKIGAAIAFQGKKAEADGIVKKIQSMR